VIDLFLHNPLFFLGIGIALGAAIATGCWIWWLFRAMRP
jgi:hypothetical protein